ncbi:MAG: aminoglycoside phosphotransferase family protein [Clostridia bacterium]|nr:aminoglycoside phosphotransferase family protein [Clostridia bacterium]
MVSEEKLLSVAGAFGLSSFPKSVSPLGNGHINLTFLLTDSAGKKYVLQRINDAIFTDIDALMKNILHVTEYLNALKPLSSLRFIRTLDGASYLKDESGCYRLYEYVEGVSLEKANSPKELGICWRAFGEFQMSLSGFDASRLSETIPRFHDTVNRLEKLEAAARADVCGRLKSVKTEYDFYISRRREARHLIEMQKADALPLRVTHNDTKLNNVILDSATLEPKCVIDLDTVMPGLSANDFGDCVRSGASTGAEDERDLSKVSLDLELYKAFASGFIASCSGALTDNEISALPWGAYLMTLECGARFLTDYLSGDTYFHISYPEHNLVRARTQMKLVSDSEKHAGDISRLIEEARN